MDFKEATDRLTAEHPITLGEVAAAFGKTLNTISRMRSGKGANDLSPPPDWSATVARLARVGAQRHRERAAELERLADEVERGGM
ncbi:MAG: hypothetical protein M3P24_11350 [Gemmatimonadota bacterium]|nr:hypothetical protein [Gemmatimonadota bacterium]